MAWTVGYIEDRNVRSTLFSFIYNLAEALGSGYISDILYAPFLTSIEMIWAACLAGLIIGAFAAASAFAILIGTKYHYKSVDLTYNEISSDEDEERQSMVGADQPQRDQDPFSGAGPQSAPVV